MHVNSKHFLNHDAERFEAYLDSLADGTTKISGATLLPHILLAKAVASPSSRHIRGRSSSVADSLLAHIAKREAQVIDAQWDAMIARLRSTGTLDNCLAICDVSGSMGSFHMPHNTEPDPILPAVALSMTLAQLAKPPFSNIFVTFSGRPEIVTLLEGAGLAANATIMAQSQWGYNTNLHAVFVRLLLPLAVKRRVPREEMVKRLFVFSDMQFDAADGAGGDAGSWETNHDAIARAYAEAGYDVPEIVYWNLAGELQTVPVEAERKGVALMSGFSPAMMKVFMGEDEPAPRKRQEMTPLSVMMKALGMASYDNLVVLD